MPVSHGYALSVVLSRDGTHLHQSYPDRDVHHQGLSQLGLSKASLLSHHRARKNESSLDCRCGSFACRIIVSSTPSLLAHEPLAVGTFLAPCKVVVVADPAHASATALPQANRQR